MEWWKTLADNHKNNVSVAAALARFWIKSRTCTKTRMSPTCLGCRCGITCSEVDMLKLKVNPGHFGKQEDRAAGLRAQVQIEFHHVWRFPPGLLWVLGPLPLCLLCSVHPELRLSLLRRSPIFKRWWHFKVRRPPWLSALTFGPGLAQRFVNTAEIITVLFSGRLWLGRISVTSLLRA